MVQLDEGKLKDAVSGFQVPIKPKLLSLIQDEFDKEEPDLNLIALHIASDVGLSATILKIINSPYYGLNRQISEIKQAVMMLGLNTVSALVAALLLKEAFDGEQSSISLERFWDDAFDVANAMVFIGHRVKNEISIDMLFTVGLFQDCGIPLLAQRYMDYKEILIQANTAQSNSVYLEERAYHTNHAVLGYFIASSWHLPPLICELILRSHDFKYFNIEENCQGQLAMAILKAAENIVERTKRFAIAPDWPQVKDKVFDILGITDSDYSNIEDSFCDLSQP